MAFTPPIKRGQYRDKKKLMFFCKSCCQFKNRFTLEQCEECFKKDREIVKNEEEKRRNKNLSAIYFGSRGLEIIEPASCDGVQINEKKRLRGSKNK